MVLLQILVYKVLAQILEVVILMTLTNCEVAMQIPGS